MRGGFVPSKVRGRGELQVVRIVTRARTAIIHVMQARAGIAFRLLACGLILLACGDDAGPPSDASVGGDVPVNMPDTPAGKSDGPVTMSDVPADLPDVLIVSDADAYGSTGLPMCDAGPDVPVDASSCVPRLGTCTTAADCCAEGTRLAECYFGRCRTKCMSHSECYSGCCWAPDTTSDTCWPRTACYRWPLDGGPDMGPRTCWKPEDIYGP
jgi:hypothetical protein